VIIEVDGDYWHSYGKVYEEMTPTQKRNARVDKIKNEWALSHGIPIIRIWEHEINKEPKKVLKLLEDRLGIELEKRRIEENKKKRH
jgi:very-short-patch-repair endonuclease